MDWLKIIENRHTTFAWDEENVPSKELLLEVLQEVYTHIPSKNLQFPEEPHAFMSSRSKRPSRIEDIITPQKENNLP